MVLAAYACFTALVIALIALDLGVLHRKAHAPSMKESLGFTVLWISCGLAFSGIVYWGYESHVFGLGRDIAQLSGHAPRDVGGGEAVLLYLTGYALEKALALDNLFVMLFVFRALKVDGRYQHRVLFWGILGALILRGGMIAVGAAVVHRFEWILYVFGALLVWSGVKLMRPKKEGAGDEELPVVVRWIHRYLPVERSDSPGFFVKTERGWALTVSFLALVSIEIADAVFAVDSIPAIFAVTLDPFIVLTSNVLAMLGLRSLYFVLAAAADRLVYLGRALAIVLVFVGVKMIALYWDLHIPPLASLAFIALTMTIGIVASLRVAAKKKDAPAPAASPAAPIHPTATQP
ncbi:MAG: TerC/Alx family metal homeostasis membrane protein [Deltaproteobacteria bacterium]|nr:TerC/Alx family metal homeostasis membrane protein [Deltaproteobacteria bacterium]